MTEELHKHNAKVYKEMCEGYRKTMKRLLKAIPKTDLVEMLKELKIIKKDYVTGEVTLKNRK